MGRGENRGQEDGEALGSCELRSAHQVALAPQVPEHEGGADPEHHPCLGLGDDCHEAIRSVECCGLAGSQPGKIHCPEASAVTVHIEDGDRGAVRVGATADKVCVLFPFFTSEILLFAPLMLVRLEGMPMTPLKVFDPDVLPMVRILAVDVFTTPRPAPSNAATV